MMKRKLVILLSFLLALVAGYYLFSGEDLPFSKDDSIYKAVPVSAPFFFEFSSVKALAPDNPFFSELNEAEIGNFWFELIQKADSLVGTIDEIPNNLRNQPFILSFGFAGRNELVPLVIIRAESENRQSGLETLIQKLYPSNAYSFTVRDYGKHIIREIHPVGTGNSFFYSFAGGLFIMSPRSILLEQVLRQLSTPGILKNPYFTEANRQTAGQGVSLFVNHAWMHSFFGNLLSRSVTPKTDEFGAEVRLHSLARAEKFREFAGWSGLGLQTRNEQLILSGISAADDSLNHFLAVFNDQQPVRFRAEELLPLNTSFFCSFAFSNKEAFFDRLERYFAHSADYYHREERMKRFDQGVRASIRNVFREIVKDEVIVAATTIPVNPDNKTVYFIMHTENRSAAEEQLLKLLNNYAVRTNQEFDRLMTGYSTENGLKFTVYHFPYPSFPGLWLGAPFAMAHANFVAFYDNYMVFSNSEQGLHDYMRNMTQGSTLLKDMRYRSFRQNSSNRANINVFVDVNKAYSMKNELFAANILKEVDEKEEVIRKMGMASWQVQRYRNRFQNSLVIGDGQETGLDAQTIWEVALGSNLAGKPQLSINHDDRSNREIVFQDNLHNLHQVSRNGRVRWTLPLPGPIPGEIHQIDYYRNGKLQYLFNTKEKLWLVDRNGNNVAHFPVDLPSPATNGVNVFDYDNNRNYRFFIAGENLGVYALDQSGKIISGWKFDRTESPVTLPVQHFRVNGGDYIVFADNSSVYILDRQGETRIPTPQKLTISNNPPILNLTGTPKIVLTDRRGNVHYIYFDGRHEEKSTARFSENHFFSVDDLDGNGTPDFVFVDGSNITVLSENGRRMFSRKLNSPLLYPPSIYTFSDDLKKVGVADAASNRIYLFDSGGKLHPGFPLQGNTPFTIGKLTDNSETFNLLTGSEGGRFLNYELK